MRRKIFTLTILLLGAFFLFSPQISQALACKCTATLPSATKYFRCVYLDPAGPGNHFADCDQFKTSLVLQNESDYKHSVAVNAILVASEFNTADIKDLNDSNVSCASFSDFYCLVPVAPSAPVETPLDTLKKDLTAKKPILEINFPGINFSDVKSSADGTGTYLYLAWIQE